MLNLFVVVIEHNYLYIYIEIEVKFFQKKKSNNTKFTCYILHDYLKDIIINIFCLFFVLCFNFLIC